MLLGKRDTEMTFILERVHSISMHTFIYFSVFVDMIAKRHFVPIQVNPQILVLVRNFIMVVSQAITV